MNHQEENNSKIVVHIDTTLSVENILINATNLYGILSTNWLFNAPRIGIPQELVKLIYDDYSGLKVFQQSKNEGAVLQVACLPPEGMDQLEYLFKIISLFNCTTKITASIYCSNKDYIILKDYANDNLLFVVHPDSQKSHAITSLSTGAVITFGSGATHFIKQKIPVVIIGPYGFGGLITPDNFQYMVKNGFMGRPGGHFGEIIPPALFSEEMLFINKTKDLSFILEETKKLADALTYHSLSEAGRFIELAKELCFKIYDEKQRWLLKPRIASNIEIVENKENICLRRSCVHDTVAVLEKAHMDFLKNINGKSDCRRLFSISGMGNTVFWKNMYLFWDKKIIIF